MECWEITLGLDGKWHCFHVGFYEWQARLLAWTNLKAIKAQAKWVVEAPGRSQALTIARRSWAEEQNLKREEPNIISALPTMREEIRNA